MDMKRGTVVAYIKVLIWGKPHQKKLRQNLLYPGRDSNPRPPEHGSHTYSPKPNLFGQHSSLFIWRSLKKTVKTVPQFFCYVTSKRSENGNSSQQ